MSGLVIKLSPRERILINGAVIENGVKRGRISIVSQNANVLRLKDALHPTDANTPVRRVCYIAQLVLSGDIPPEEAKPQIINGIGQLQDVMKEQNCQVTLACALAACSSEQYYQGLKMLRRLIPFEDALLAGSLS